MSNILIIGATSSVGQFVVKEFASSNNNSVTATYNASTKQKNTTNVQYMKLDLGSNSGIDLFVSNLDNSKKKIDVCVFLSGILPGSNIEDYTMEEVDRVMSINFIGFSKLIKQLYPLFSNNSQLIAVSSISSDRGSYDPIYAASKGALVSFIKSLSQVRPLKVRANAISPGLITDTTMYQDMDIKRRQNHCNSAPTEQLTKKEDIAKIIVDLCGPHWCNMNGEVIKINGGYYV